MIPNQISKNYADSVYNLIVSDILNRVLNEGDKLNEKELISKLGFSRTPIREALIMLERDGFVKTVGREGTYVRKLTQNDIRDIYIVREALEGMAARLGAKTISDDNILILASIVEQMEIILQTENFEGDEFIKLDMEFHKTIVDSCHIKLLSSICYNLGLLSASIRIKGAKYTEHINQYQKQHQEIFKAFEQRNEVLAESLLCEHIRKGKIDVILAYNIYNNS